MSFKNEFKEKLNARKWLQKILSRFYYGSITEYNTKDHLHQWLLRLNALTVVIFLFLMLSLLFKLSFPAMKTFGLSFIWNQEWNPVTEEYGALTFIFGTLFSSLASLFFAAPISVGVALFITQLCPKNLKMVFTTLIEILASIPSIIYGLWALHFLSPLVREDITTLIQERLQLESFPLFAGASFGIGMMTAIMVLTIMIIPTITAVSIEVFKSMPLDLKHASLALGSTRWEAIYLAVFRPGLSGVIGATILGLGRALGETMAVAMVIGNKATISLSLFSAAATMSSVIANEYAEATTDLHLASLGFIGLLLFVVSFIINSLARLLVWKMNKAK